MGDLSSATIRATKTTERFILFICNTTCRIYLYICVHKLLYMYSVVCFSLQLVQQMISHPVRPDLYHSNQRFTSHILYNLNIFYHIDLKYISYLYFISQLSELHGVLTVKYNIITDQP